MSYVTSSQLSSFQLGINRTIELAFNELESEIDGLAAKSSQLFTRMGRVEDTNAQQWTEIGKRAVAADVWNKIKSLDAKIASLDAKNASQDASIANIWGSVDTAHKTNASQNGLGISGFLGGLGTGTLIAGGILALVLLRGK